jgi:elongation factor G
MGSESANPTESIRNIAVVGHAGAGKTTLIEALLGAAGEIRASGRGDRGFSVCDFTDQEKRLHHSLDVHLCHVRENGCSINLLDTPGYPDFMGRALAALPAVETAAVVVNAEQGTELVARRMMALAAEQRLCRLVIINKIDAERPNLASVLDEIRADFGEQCLPLNLPAQGGSAVVDCFFAPDLSATTDVSSVAAAHTAVIDRIIELDDALMERYLEQGEEPSPQELHEPLERALREGHLTPVCFVSAKTGAGLKELQRVLTDLLPNPLEANRHEVFDSAPQQREIDPDDGRFIGHVFKVNVDPYMGRLAAVRVHCGKVSTGAQVFVGDNRKPITLTHLYSVQGKALKEVPAAVAGDFFAVAKIDGIQAGDVLHSSHDDDGLKFKTPPLPAPMHSVAIELKRRDQEKRLSDALHLLTLEDPSLSVEFRAHSNETVLRGMGELHLRLVLERMASEFGLEVVTHAPKIAYRETVTRVAEGHHRHKKQTGGAGQFGEVYLRVEPLARGAGFEFVNEVVGGAIPTQYIPAVEKGVRQVLTEGAIAGYPVTDVRVVVYDGKYHSVDSKEIAFVTAGLRAFKDGIAKATPIIIEPIGRLAITVPTANVGDITGHLASIRGKTLGTEALPQHRSRIRAQAPLAELSDYQTTLKSLTSGSGQFVLEVDHYDPVPPTVQQELMKQYRPRSDD